MADLFDKCRTYTAAREVMAAGLYPYFKPIERNFGTEVIVKGKRLIMMASNNYLGLTVHPKVIEASIKAVEKYGSGCTGSRFLNGTLELHEQLEERLAQLTGHEAALVFSTGFQTNLGAISAVVGKRDAAIIDRADHASIVDGCRLSFGTTLKFKHNDMADLECVLQKAQEFEGRLIVVDGVFSMEGDICPLPDVVALAKRYDTRVMVDDAHSLGVLGKSGSGTSEHFGLKNEVDMVMGTFSKSFASLGGFVAADESVIHYIKHNARAMIFSASMPPAAVAAVLACIDILKAEPERRERLWRNAEHLRKGLHSLGFSTGRSETPIVPVVVGENEVTFRFWKGLFDNGLFVNSAVSPAVPPGHGLLRTSVMATHEISQIDHALEIFEKVGKELGFI
ncbi:MAG TPA: pyridoxal phosphate-dependent aminotransferase family protein [Planctomycetota bacterium]|nr:pyridoxal phosphate-dependent aminotransferase family protein [Planctomycetota bacterium]